MALDTTMSSTIEMNSGPKGGSSAPAPDWSTTMESGDMGAKPSAARPAGMNKDVGPGETPCTINSVFYDPTSGSPGTLDTTLDDVLEMSFGS